MMKKEKQKGKVYLIESFFEFHPGAERLRQLSTLQLANFSGLPFSLVA